jgi:hypothetical protein
MIEKSILRKSAAGINGNCGKIIKMNEIAASMAINTSLRVRVVFVIWAPPKFDLEDLKMSYDFLQRQKIC